VRIAAIAEEVHHEIIGDRLAMMERSDRIARRLIAALLEGGGVSEVLDALTAAVGNPALLVHSSGDVVAVAISRAGPREVLAAFESGHPSWSAEIPWTKESWGTLVLVAVDKPIDEFSRVCGDHAARAVALALLRRHEDELLTLREQGAFLDAGARGELAIEDVAIRADVLHFAHDGLALLPFAVAPTSGSLSHAWAAAGRGLRRELKERRVAVLLGAAPTQPVLLGIAAVPPGRARQRSVLPLSEAVESVASTRLGTRTRTRLAVARPCTRWADAMPALRDAADVATCAVASEWMPWFDAAKPGLPVLLRRLGGSPEFSNFAERQLEQLEAIESQNGIDVLSTLRALCDHGWSKASAARALNLERPSLYYHIKRIERLLGESLDDPLVRTQLHLALLARDWVAAA
jgi:purine catabolism regulator